MPYLGLCLIWDHALFGHDHHSAVASNHTGDGQNRQSGKATVLSVKSVPWGNEHLLEESKTGCYYSGAQKVLPRSLGGISEI